MKRFVLLLTVLLAGLIFRSSPSLAAAEPVDYLREVKPILARHCYSCHGAAQQKMKLRLDTAASIRKGGSGGPALVAGKSEDSLLFQAITGAEGVTAMPYKKPRLPDEQIALIKKWIDEGAKAPADEPPDDGKSRHWAFQPPVRAEAPAVQQEAWARTPIDRFILARLEKEGIQPGPEADRVTLIRRLGLDLLGLPPSIEEVDAFVKDAAPDAYERLVDRLLASPHYGERWGRHWLDLARYADSNGFNIDAPREIWKYRDWVIDALNRDMPFDQFTIEQIAGDLLPAVGDRPSAIGQNDAHTSADSRQPTADSRIATGFHRNTLINQEGGIDAEQFRVEAVVDRVNTTASVFLGLTLGCAQCHDHKFDPFTQKEYYQLFAFFNNCDEPTLELPTPEQARERKRIRGEIAQLQRQIKELDLATPTRQAEWQQGLSVEARLMLSAEIRGILDLAENSRTAKQKQQLAAVYRKLDQVRHLAGGLAEAPAGLPGVNLHLAMFRASAEKHIAELRKSEPDIVTTMVVQERAKPRDTTIHIQGDFTRKGAPVASGVPAVLHSLAPRFDAPGSPTRLDFARWIVDPRNPLTARVIVNRLWQQYFGTGLVETSNDFGVQGTPPTHAELLDWLAVEFLNPSETKSETRNSKSETNAKSEIRNPKLAWSLKHMHRLIVTSATYRQSSRHRPELAKLDATNKLLGRQNRLRLEAEVVRDVSLTASGLLNRQIGGPSVFPPQPEGVFKFTQIQKDWKPSAGPDRYRRGMYTHFWRSAPHPALMVFDAPESTTTCTRRNRSNTPLQSLTLLNDQAFFEFAQALAGRALREGPKNEDKRVRYLFRLCLSREPSDAELQRLVRLAAEQRAEFEADPEAAKSLASTEFAKGIEPKQFAAWAMVARVLLNLDEFITRE